MIINIVTTSDQDAAIRVTIGSEPDLWIIAQVDSLIKQCEGIVRDRKIATLTEVEKFAALEAAVIAKEAK